MDKINEIYSPPSMDKINEIYSPPSVDKINETYSPPSEDKMRRGPIPRNGTTSDKRLVVRLTEQEREEWKEKSKRAGYKSLSDMIRHLMEVS